MIILERIQPGPRHHQAGFDRTQENRGVLTAGRAAHAPGDDIEAAHWFVRSRSACGPAALYAEEYDPPQSQLRGNLPQAFVHAAMLESAVRLSGPASLGSA